MRKIAIFVMLAFYPIFFYAQTYNPQAAADYANYWWDGRNTNNGIKDVNNYNITWGTPYHNYNSFQKSGDCANFVSQCLIDGGLDLRLGAYGAYNGGEVDNHGCIKAAKELVMHLSTYQKTDTFRSKAGNGPFSKSDLGDPAFLINVNNNPYHSKISAAIFGSQNFYNAHSADCYQVTLSNSDYVMYFHIKSSIPDHCGNCKHDEGEDAIDCGGSCPPCGHVKSAAVNYTSNTSSLPSETRSFEGITAGNANVQVLSGQDVTFVTSGEIVLKPGFSVHKGATFNAQAKSMRKSVGYSCEFFCNPNIDDRFNFFCRSRGDYFYWELAGFVSYTVTIYQKEHDNVTLYEIYNSAGNIGADGPVRFWDLNTDLKTSHGWDVENFWADIELTTCTGYVKKFTHQNGNGFHFYVKDNCQKSLNSNNDMYDESYNESYNEPEVSYDNLNGEVLDKDCFIHPNPNDGTFTIKINFDPQEVNSVRVLSTVGQVIYQQTGLPNNTIQLPSSAKGMFWVEIYTTNKKFIKKMVVQ